MVKRLAIIGNQAFAMRNFRGALISALASRGIEVFAFAPDYKDADRAAIHQLGGTPVAFPLKRASVTPILDLTTLGVLARELRRVQPDAVLSFTAKPVIYGTLAAVLARVPSRVALFEGLGHAFIVKRGVYEHLLRLIVILLYRLSLARADRVLFLNEDDRRAFVDDAIVPAEKTLNVGAIGVDLDEWRPAPPVVDPMTFLFVGRLLREKGIMEFVEAARIVKRIHPQAKFVVLGAPDSNPSSVTARQAQSWVDAGFVEWPGHVDVKPWLEKASVFVLPSYREGLPRSTQEAMAMGRPVITTNAPGCRDTVVEGDNGYLVPVADAEALAAAMTRFVVDRSLVRTMGISSRRLAEARFDVRSASERLVAAIGL